MEALSGLAVLAVLAVGVVLLILGIFMPWFMYRTMVFTHRTWQAVERLEKRQRQLS